MVTCIKWITKNSNGTRDRRQEMGKLIFINLQYLEVVKDCLKVNVDMVTTKNFIKRGIIYML